MRDYFETKTPITGFYPVSQVKASMPRWFPRENSYSCELEAPIGGEIYSPSSHPEIYHRLYREYGIAETTYTSHAPIPEVFYAEGIRGLRVAYEGRADHHRTDLTSSASLVYPEYLRLYLTVPLGAEREVIRLPGYSSMRDKIVGLEELTQVDLRWIFWIFKHPSSVSHPVRLYVGMSGLDLSQGRLLLLVERQGDSPLEVELPQK